ncbi:unnamed protein product [Nippostrongylus brasiliensis]|uniref:Secreted protein n=1 Tax=Nippostrongylus brasiliensis TaxID=27835 RepID=A0A0N4Y7N3_NIPBR|nr:unnamed protein product [Nippostrongylus brasiliensis]
MIGASLVPVLVLSGHRVLITATTNVATTHVTPAPLRLHTMSELPLCRYTAETIAFDSAIPPKGSCMHDIMKTTPNGFVTRSYRSPSSVVVASELDGFEHDAPMTNTACPRQSVMSYFSLK